MIRIVCPVCRRNVGAADTRQVNRHNDTAGNRCPMGRRRFPVAGTNGVDEMEGEQWAPVVGHGAEHYDVSTLGRIRRRDTGRILKPYRGDALGILKVALSVRGVVARRSVHSIVLETFVGPAPEGMQARHIRKPHTNNELANLEYATPAERMRAVYYGNPHAPVTECVRGHEYTESNTYVDPNGRRKCRACRSRWRVRKVGK